MRMLPTMGVLVLLGLFFATTTVAQSVSYSFAPEGKIWIEGKSNKSDWTVYAPEYAGNVSLSSASASDPGIEQVNLTVTSPKIVSRKSTIMDRLMYKTLKSKAHPEITYVLDSATVTSTDESNKSFMLKTTGDLTIAGTTKPVEMEVEGKLDGDMFHFSGSHAMKMSDFGLERPTAMFGALRTADDILIHFDLKAMP